MTESWPGQDGDSPGHAIDGHQLTVAEQAGRVLDHQHARDAELSSNRRSARGPRRSRRQQRRRGRDGPSTGIGGMGEPGSGSISCSDVAMASSTMRTGPVAAPRRRSRRGRPRTDGDAPVLRLGERPAGHTPAPRRTPSAGGDHGTGVEGSPSYQVIDLRPRQEAEVLGLVEQSSRDQMLSQGEVGRASPRAAMTQTAFTRLRERSKAVWVMAARRTARPISPWLTAWSPEDCSTIPRTSAS